MTPNTPAPGWARSDLTIKLSKKRLAQLQRIAAMLRADATPTDAIDHALETVIAHGAIDERLTDLEEAMERWGMEHRFEVDRIEAAIASLAKGIEGLHALISAVAQSENY